MRYMNEYEIENALIRFNRGDTPNLGHGAFILARLATWTNRNSDGWAYWPKPCRAAQSLQALLQTADRFDPVDVTAAELKRATSPIKAFLTRQGVDHAEILDPPAPPTNEPAPLTAEEWRGVVKEYDGNGADLLDFLDDRFGVGL